jgi:hypothetical protein
MTVMVVVTVAAVNVVLRLLWASGHLVRWYGCTSHVVRAALDYLVKLAAVQPDAPALWAIVDFDVQTLGHEQIGGGAGWAFHIFPLDVNG